VPDAEKESELLICEAAGLDRVALYRDDPEVSAEAEALLMEALRRRSLREPIQYITGRADFFGLSLRVGPGVLVPRPETELVVEEALGALSGLRSPLVLDLCAGSGAIALAIARGVPGARVIATDVSAEALRFARENAALAGAGNVELRQGSLFEPVSETGFDCVVSNPPYVESGVIDTLEPEVRQWEPRGALDGGPDGLRFYRLIIPEAARRLAPGGWLVLEVGGRAAEIGEMARLAGLAAVSVRKDLAGLDRVLRARRPA